MATIKTTGTGPNKRIISKIVNGQRRISCSCCAEAECCMYPSQGVIDGVVALEDLPNLALDWFDPSTTYTKLGSPVSFTPSQSGGTYTEYYTFGLGIWSESGRWHYGAEDGAVSSDSFACLFGGFAGSSLVKDEFADTYTLYAWETVVLERQSLCVWFGTGESGCTYSLIYGDRGNGTGEPNKWSVDWIALPFCGEGEIAIKQTLQNSPVGEYLAPINNITVEIA